MGNVRLWLRAEWDGFAAAYLGRPRREVVQERSRTAGDLADVLEIPHPPGSANGPDVELEASGGGKVLLGQGTRLYRRSVCPIVAGIDTPSRLAPADAAIFARARQLCGARASSFTGPEGI